MFAATFRLIGALWVLAGSLLWAVASQAAPAPVKVAVLKFGTVSWELSTVQSEGLDRQHGIQLELLPLASMMATQTALKSGEVDVIVADWLWVARQRAANDKLLFMPFSTSVGKLVVRPDAGIESLESLAGKRIGVAGGPLSKGWLLLQAASLKRGLDLKRQSTLQFGAPPLLNAALKQGQLDAVVTFWHYAARLEADGFPVLTDLNSLSKELGMVNPPPMLGYVFTEAWAKQHPERVSGLADAVAASRRVLSDSDAAWERLRPQMRAESDEVFHRLREGYLAGTPTPVSEQQLTDAERMFALLSELGGQRLVGNATELDRTQFWQP